LAEISTLEQKLSSNLKEMKDVDLLVKKNKELSQQVDESNGELEEYKKKVARLKKQLKSLEDDNLNKKESLQMGQKELLLIQRSAS